MLNNVFKKAQYRILSDNILQNFPLNVQTNSKQDDKM